MTICYLGNFIAIHECIRPVYVLDYTEVTLHNTSFVNYWIRRRRKRVVIHPNFRIAVMESHASFSQVTCVKCCIVIIETESRFFLRESDRHYGPVNLKEEEAPLGKIFLLTPSIPWWMVVVVHLQISIFRPTFSLGRTPPPSNIVFFYFSYSSLWPSLLFYNHTPPFKKKKKGSVVNCSPRAQKYIWKECFLSDLIECLSRGLLSMRKLKMNFCFI